MILPEDVAFRADHRRNEKATPYQALKAVTIHAAYAFFEEQTKGSLETGKVTDFVILDQTPQTVAPMVIKKYRS
jgi:hypothetical protein